MSHSMQKQDRIQWGGKLFLIGFGFFWCQCALEPVQYLRAIAFRCQVWP